MSARVRIEKVNADAIAAGYGRGWHLFIDGEYANTFCTRDEAREAARRSKARTRLELAERLRAAGIGTLEADAAADELARRLTTWNDQRNERADHE